MNMLSTAVSEGESQGVRVKVKKHNYHSYIHTHKSNSEGLTHYHFGEDLLKTVVISQGDSVPQGTLGFIWRHF